jgi:exonuclease III
MMKVVSWNCRGLGSRDKKEEVRKLLKLEKPSILLIQETKMRDLETLQDLQKIWKKGEGKEISSRGASGGIGTFWNVKDFNLEDQVQSQFWLMVSLTRKATCMVYSIINVYMPNNYLEKIECWRSLQDLATENPPQNLIIVGDFNTTRGLKEK